MPNSPPLKYSITASNSAGSLSTHCAERLSHLQISSVWTEFTPLAQLHQATNLGQGAPDFPAPNFVKDALRKSTDSLTFPYTRSQGHKPLVEALSAVYSPRFHKDLDPLNHVLVANGATEAIFVTIMAFCSPGDEVILIEPFYDSYPACIRLAGGTPVYVPLLPKVGSNSAAEWILDMNTLKKAITKKTKMIIINNPSNIPGKVWTHQELQNVANVAIESDIIVLSDEVYEWHTFEGQQHIPIATLPKMWPRTVTIGSAGKAFSVPGFRLGWAFGDTNLISAVQSVHTQVTFCCPVSNSDAIAESLNETSHNSYWKDTQHYFDQQRKSLITLLNQAGLTPVVPQGGYFALADTSKVPDSLFLDNNLLNSGAPDGTRDYQFCRWLTKEIKVTAIPPSAFYSPEHRHMAANYARFAFCKQESTLRQASERLTKLRQLMPKL